jgi:hypothetical protein
MRIKACHREIDINRIAKMTKRTHFAMSHGSSAAAVTAKATTRSVIFAFEAKQALGTP